jgi:acetate kinase
MKKTSSDILAVNIGSSSFKFKLFDAATLEAKLSGVAKLDRDKNISFVVRINSAEQLDITLPFASHNDVLDQLINGLKKVLKGHQLAAIGHRIVQGGPGHFNPVILNHKVVADLKKYIYLAPNHLPAAIDLISRMENAFPGTFQVGCFDTSFHQFMPPKARYYPLDEKYRSQGLMRYGFHGLSYEYMMAKLAEQLLNPARQKIIIAHLGSGASLVAVKEGVSVDTTMGLSPMGGMMMGTRPGDLDPAVLLFLMEQECLDASQLDDLLSKHSGLIAMAGTADLENLLLMEDTNEKAREALSMFCYQAKKAIGALCAALGGLDTLVFTGGIGANSAVIRERICQDLKFLGIILDPVANHHQKSIISSKRSWITVCAFETNEEQIIAQHTQTLLNLTK